MNLQRASLGCCPTLGAPYSNQQRLPNKTRIRVNAVLQLWRARIGKFPVRLAAPSPSSVGQIDSQLCLTCDRRRGLDRSDTTARTLCTLLPTACQRAAWFQCGWFCNYVRRLCRGSAPRSPDALCCVARSSSQVLHMCPPSLLQ